MMKFSKEEWRNIEFVCDRDEIEIKRCTKDEEYVYVDIECSEERMEEILEDAKCEEQRNKTQARLPVYSYRTIKNPKKLHRLMELNGKRGFHVLQDDLKKCEEEGMFG